MYILLSYPDSNLFFSWVFIYLNYLEFYLIYVMCEILDCLLIKWCVPLVQLFTHGSIERAVHLSFNKYESTLYGFFE